MATNKENLLAILNHKIPEEIPRASADVVWDCFPSVIVERGPSNNPEEMYGGTGYDWFGVHWTYVPAAYAATPSPDYPHVLTDITKWREQVEFPDIDSIDWKAAWEKDSKSPDYSSDKFSYFFCLNGPFERLHALMGFEEALVSIALEPDACREFFEAVVDFKIRLLDHVLEYYHVDLYEQHDDYGHQTNTFLSIDQWNDVLAPPMKRLIDHCKEKGVIFQLHSCGKIDTLIPSLVDIGLEHWSSCQEINDLEGILHKYGDRLTLWSGICFDEYEGQEVSEEKQRELLEEKVFKMCKGGAFIPDMWEESFIDTYNKMLKEKKDFYKNPENRKLP